MLDFILAFTVWGAIWINPAQIQTMEDTKYRCGRWEECPYAELKVCKITLNKGRNDSRGELEIIGSCNDIMKRANANREGFDQ